MRIINADCLEYLREEGKMYDVIFADPPDNIGLGYGTCLDNLETCDYLRKLHDWWVMFIRRTNCLWVSFNPKWVAHFGGIVAQHMNPNGLTPLDEWTFKPCVQTFTFGQHNHHDLGVNHRPLWRWNHICAPLYPDAIRVESERQKAGDRRADPRGRVPGDVFDFPRVTGNSKQRRKWHPTQLHEGLVERCLKLTCPPGGHVLDPFGGTGTTGRVCKRLGLNCTLIDIDAEYCDRMREELL